MALPTAMGVWTTGLLLCVTSCERHDAADCSGYCGEGTECAAGKCIPVHNDEPAEVAEVSGPAARKKRRVPGAAADPSSPFVAPDDSRVPPYDDDRAHALDPEAGGERLDERSVTRHMGKLEGRFNQCIAAAAEHSPSELGRGTVSFRINVEPDGRVTGVSAEASSNLRVFGIVPCMRLAVHGSRFPKWDGPPMRVEYRFDVD